MRKKTVKYFVAMVAVIFTGSVITGSVMASTAAFAQQQNRAVTNKAVYIVDGKIVTQQYMNALPVDKIANMEVITNIEKVIVVKTNNPSATTNNLVSGEIEFKPIKQVKTSNGDVFRIVADEQGVVNVSKTYNGKIQVKGSVFPNPADDQANPLYLIRSYDGQIELAHSKKISPEQILSMVVIHGKQAHAYQKYGDVSKGVVLISLKPEKNQKTQKTKKKQ